MIALLKALAFLVGHVPPLISRPAGSMLGMLMYTAGKSHRKRAFENLDRAYNGEITTEEKSRIVKGVFEHMGLMFFEFLRLPWLKKEGLEGYVECEGLENLKKALEKKKGVILFTAHFGNWELMAAYYGLLGYTIDIVVRDVDSPALEEFVRWARTRHGNRIISKNRSMRKLLKSLAANGIVGILLDQNVARNEGVFVDFFGVPACTNKGPALLATTSGAAVVPTFIVRQGGRHRIFVGEELKLSNTGDRDSDILKNTALCTKVIEEMVRKHPEQWFWVHRRWKTRPE